MPITALAREIRQALDDAADPVLRQKYQRLVPGARVLGVSVPALRELAARTKKAYPELALNDTADLLDVYAKTPIREEMLVGIFLLARFGRHVEALPWKRLERWSASLDNWETCDQLAANIAARIVHAHAEHVPALLKLAKAKDPWVRRFALATSADLTHKGRGNATVAFDVCRQLLNDESPMIQTAIAWALREASKADPDATQAFLERHGARMRPRTLKEASAKLPRPRIA